MKKKPIMPLLIIQIAILFLPACGQKGPLPPADKVPPAVSLISPINGAQNVPVNCSVLITFSEEMDASTINEQTITLSTGNGNVPGSVTYSDKIAVFKPASDLNPATIHTVTVDGSVADSGGNAMATPFGYIFITGTASDTTPPNISATNPADGALDVFPNAALSVTFNEPVDEATITFTLSAGSAIVPCTLTYAGTTAIVTPSTGLAYGTQYAAAVKAGVVDMAGNAMPLDYSWTFTTGARPDTTPPSVTANTPGIGATDVSVNTPLNVTFSEAVDQPTITFLLSAGSVTVPCTMTYSGTTAIFTPETVLAYDTQYTAVVKSGVVDMAGNAMPSDYSWTFTTGSEPDTTPPTILPETLVPADNANNVSLSPSISATFSEPVNPATVNSATVKLSVVNGPDVPGTVTLDSTGVKVILLLAGRLEYNTTYTVTIIGGETGVKDMAGNALLDDYAWSFKTIRRWFEDD